MQKSASPEIREALRALIARVEVHPAEAGQRPSIELIRHLATLLGAAVAELLPMFFRRPRGMRGQDLNL